jgi:DNA-binding NtrC family response regulator
MEKPAPKKTILLVEDEPMVRRVCEAALLKTGFDVILAHNGVEGLAAFAQHHNEISLILADVWMPLMDGVEMVRRIHKVNSGTNVILITGFASDAAIPADLRNVCGVLDKPFTMARLLGAIEERLSS